MSFINSSGRPWCISFRKTLHVLFGAVGVLLLCLPAFSQGNFGRILGTVTDQSGGVVANATVSVIDTERNTSRTLSTDDAGEYNAPNLVPSSYTVRAEAKGFKKIERVGVELGVGKEIRVDLVVQPGQQEQTVTVTESIPLVETTNATLGGTLNNADIVDMPLNGRNYQNLLGLRPGVMTQPGGSPWTQSTNNSRPDESVWMVDGVINVNMYDYRPVGGMPSPFTDGATILPVDAIQEFNIMENPKAEYGWRPGAVVNVGVKSGTNSLHGSAYGFYRSGNWDARNVFNPVPKDKLPTALKQFGGTVGGPIKKDKLFFFGGYEGLRSFVGNAIGTSVPATGKLGDPSSSMPDAIAELQANHVKRSPVSENLFGCTGDTPGDVSGAAIPVTCTGGVIANAPATTTTYNSGFPNTNVSDNGVGKMDYRLNDKHSINGMVLIGNYYGNGEDHPVVNSYWQNGDPIRTYTVGADWVWTPSSRLVNDARFGFDRVSFALTNDDSKLLADGSGGLCTATSCGGKGFPLNTGITSVTGFPTVTIASFSPLGGWRGRPVEFTNPYYDFQDSISYLAGKHSFKFGVEYTHIHADINLHDTRGRIDFQDGKHVAIAKGTPGLPDGSSALDDFFAGTPSRGSQLVGTTARNLSWHNIAGFVQDDWRATSKLIINLGLRYSYVSPIREDNNLLGSFDPTLGLVQQGQPLVGDTLWKKDYKDFSPRAGFAWDLSGKGTTVIRGGVSRIYSIFTPAQFMQSPFQNFKNGTIAAVPTGGCTVNFAPPATCTSAGGTTFGGTIGLGSASIKKGNLNWDPAINGAARNGGVVFPVGAGVSCTASSQCDLTTVSSNLLTPNMTNWNLGITHAFTNNLSLEVSYVGNHGSNMTGFVDLNQSPVGSAFCKNATLTPAQLNPIDGACNPLVPSASKGDPEQQARPFVASFPYLRYVNMTVNDARSNYHSLQATLTERVSHGLSFTAGYTFGHGLDNGSLNRFGNLPQNSLNPGAEYGNSDFDIRNRLTVTATYDLPSVKGYAQLLEGWKINTIVTVQGALPWLVDDNSNDFSGSGQEAADRWDFFGNPGDFKSGPNSIPFCSGFGVDPATGAATTGGASCSSQSGISGIVTPLPSSLASQCAAVAPDPTTLKIGGCFVSGRSVMTPPTAGTFGTMGRNIFRDSGFKNVDFSVFKTFTYKERYSAQFRAEVFNLFNHPIISNPYGAANGAQLGYDPSGASTFGCGCATPDTIAGNPLVGSGSSRVLQVGLKLTF
jgi:hypothetical protein